MSIEDDLLGKNPELESAVAAYLDAEDPRSALEQLKANGFIRRFDIKLDPPTMIIDPDNTVRREPQSLMYFRDEKIFVYFESWILIKQPNTSWQAGPLG